MRVLQVINTYYPELKFGGPPLKVHALSKGLLARGHAVTVLTFDSQNRAAQGQKNFDGVNVQYLPWTGWGLRQWPTHRELIADAIQQADIVQGYGLYNALCPIAANLARRKHRPFLIEPLGMYQPRARNQFIKRLYHRLVTRRLFREAACVVAASAAERDELKDAVGSTRLVLRRNGIDVEALQNLPPGDEFRNKFNVPPGERIVLYLGRISPVKNLEDLVRAFAQAAVRDCRLVLAGPLGEPDYAERLRRLIGTLHLEKTVLLAGPLYDRDKLAALAAADLFVLPSLSESFGNAAAEAVAAGVPVLLTDTCGIAPLIHERAGLAVPLGVDAIANGLRKMLEDGGQADEAASALHGPRADEAASALHGRTRTEDGKENPEKLKAEMGKGNIQPSTSNLAPGSAPALWSKQSDGILRQPCADSTGQASGAVLRAPAENLRSPLSALRSSPEDGRRRTALTSRRADVLNELSWDEPVRQTEELYQEMLAAEMEDRR